MAEVRALPGRAGRFLVVEDVAPSVRQLRRAVRAGLGVHVLAAPNGSHSLSFLAPVIDKITRLIVTDRFCSDVSILGRAHSLKELDLWIAAKVTVPFAGMPELESYAGFGTQAQGVTQLSGLKRLDLESPSALLWNDARSPLESMKLVRATRVQSIPSLPFPEKLTTLLIHGARELSLQGLSAHTGLRDVALVACRKVSDVEELLGCGSLTRLRLENCPDIVGFEALRHLAVARVDVAGTHPFDSGFRAEVGSDADGRWIFP